LLKLKLDEMTATLP